MVTYNSTTMGTSSTTYTGSWTGINDNISFGTATTSIYDAAAPMVSLLTDPIVDIGTSSTGFLCEICGKPTLTSVASGVTNYFLGHVPSGSALTAANFNFSVNEAGGVAAATYGTTTNCSNAASPAVCSSAAAGAVTIAAGSTTVVVNTTAVTGNSEIFLQADDSLTIAATTCNSTLATLVGGLAVTARTAGTSFTISFNGTILTNPLCISYHIIN
jgi:hypothetical protein